MVANNFSKFILFCVIIIQTRCHEKGSKQEPFKIEVKNVDLIRPEVTTIGPGTTTYWDEFPTSTYTSMKHRSTVEPIIKVRYIFTIPEIC